MNNFLFFVLVTLSISIGFSQNKKTAYIDENFNEITLNEFERRLKSELFFYIDYPTDTVDYKKLKFKEFFGHLGFDKKAQLDKLFKKRYDINSNKNWVIHYYDTLPAVENMPKNKLIEIRYASSSKVVRNLETFKSFKFGLRNKKQRYWDIKNAELHYFYNYKNGYPLDKSKVKWFKDDNLLMKKLFGDSIGMHGTIIIFRHGDFYFSPTPRPIDTEKLLLNLKTRNKIRDSWKARYEKLKTSSSTH